MTMNLLVLNLTGVKPRKHDFYTLLYPLICNGLYLKKSKNILIQQLSQAFQPLFDLAGNGNGTDP